MVYRFVRCKVHYNNKHGRCGMFNCFVAARTPAPIFVSSSTATIFCQIYFLFQPLTHAHPAMWRAEALPLFGLLSFVHIPVALFLFFSQVHCESHLGEFLVRLQITISANIMNFGWIFCHHFESCLFPRGYFLEPKPR